MAVPTGNFAFVFDVAGDRQVGDSLGFAQDAVEDWRPAFDEIHRDFYKRVIPEQFSSEGARGGQPWVGYENEPVYRYIKSKILNAATFPILRWAKTSGKPQPGERLYPSLVDPQNKDHVYRKTKRTFSFGTKVPYAIKHQLGIGTVPHDKVPLPKREIIRITDADKLRWSRILGAHFASAVGKAGRVAGRGGAGRQSPTFTSYKRT